MEERENGRKKDRKDGGRKRRTGGERRKEGRKEGREKKTKDGKTERKKKPEKRARKRPVSCWGSEFKRGFFPPFGKANPNYPRPAPPTFLAFFVRKRRPGGATYGLIKGILAL